MSFRYPVFPGFRVLNKTPRLVPSHAVSRLGQQGSVSFAPGTSLFPLPLLAPSASTDPELRPLSFFLFPSDSVISMAQTSSYQLAGHNIRVNAICPGMIESGMTEAAFEMSRQRGTIGKLGHLNPLRRYGVSEGA